MLKRFQKITWIHWDRKFRRHLHTSRRGRRRSRKSAHAQTERPGRADFSCGAKRLTIAPMKYADAVCSRFPLFVAAFLLLLLSFGPPYVFGEDQPKSLLSNGDLQRLTAGSQWPEDWPHGDGVTFEKEDGVQFLRLRSGKPGQMVMVYRQMPIPSPRPAALPERLAAAMESASVDTPSPSGPVCRNGGAEIERRLPSQMSLRRHAANPPATASRR